MRWESAFGSRGTMIFVFILIALEVLALLGTILLPGFFQDNFARFILFGLIHLTFTVSSFVFLILGLAKLREKKFAALNPYCILMVAGVALFFVNQKAMTIRFLIFRNLYMDIAVRVVNQEFPLRDSEDQRYNRPLLPVVVPSRFFLVGYGQNAQVQWTEIDKNSLVFFIHSGIIFEQCGYMYSSINIMPDVSVFDFGWGARGRFNSIAPNWFYGCIKYD